ncbi:hypothetical protein [Kitasatospora sp. A2-31]|uniref:hypothetical protein n=1 Tax=Kitasatospora sp. A2-31 TaxID=2916414 RepID=UPI001EEB73FC|nr:hypothetical protein [Kitasatospora sp. A2-31]MCG6494907.1 hypothetical protein [Kitasatospora sp. A2-31]
MTVFNVNDRVTVIDRSDRDFGQTGRVFYVQSDGTLLVDQIGSGFLNALCGGLVFHPSQLKHADAQTAQG